MNFLSTFKSSDAHLGLGSAGVRRSIVVTMLLCAFVAFAPSAFAASGLTMPWESGTCQVAKAMTGPWLGWVAVIAIVVAAVAFAVGEAKGPMTTAMRIVGGISTAIAAVTVVQYFWPSAISSAAC